VPILPQAQKDQVKLIIGIVAVALSAYYYLYPYSTKAAELVVVEEHVTKLDEVNQKAKAELAKGSVDELRAQAAQYRANLELMRRLVPTGNEVPALLEQISTAARRVGLEVGNVTPEPMIAGAQFDTYRYKLSVVGGYHALAEFLTNVGSLPRIVAPVTFSLTPATTSGPAKTRAGKPGAELESVVTLQTYVARGAAPGASLSQASAGDITPSVPTP
jgi:type IV pilus assembly protein PilO